MYLFDAPQVLVWFSAAFVFGTGGFWMSFAETLAASPGDRPRQ